MNDEQFGVPVGSFQAIKHALADLHIGVTMAEHAVLYAAHAVDTGPADAPLAVSVAKAKASDVAIGSTAAMIQYHGGIGYTWEHESHFFYKRAKRLAGQYGDADAHRARIAALTDLTRVGRRRPGVSRFGPPGDTVRCGCTVVRTWDRKRHASRPLPSTQPPPLCSDCSTADR